MRLIHQATLWIYTKLALQVGLNSSNLSNHSLKKLIKQNSEITIIDVGANIGEFSKLCRGEYKNARIFAIEPQILCHEEIRINSGQDTLIIGKALSSKVGFTSFQIESGMDRKAHITNFQFGSECITNEKYETTTVDAILSEYKIETVDLLKIDTEGHDFEVLKGSQDSLVSGKIKVILFEIMPRLVKSGSTPPDIEAYLRSFGFNFFYRSTPHLGLLELNKLSECELHTQNIIATKRSIR
jgi:FkbM family methyltransferase